MGAAGRRGASPGFIYAPLGTIFSTFVGSAGALIGFSGTMDLRKLDWRFMRQLGFHFFSFPWPVMEIFVLRTLFRRGVQNPR